MGTGDPVTTLTPVTKAKMDSKLESVAVTDVDSNSELRQGLLSVGPLGLSAALEFPVYFNKRVTIDKIRSVLTLALTTADAVITAKNNAGTSMTNGALTITQDGCAVGDEDSCSPSDNNIIDTDEKMILSLDGGPDAGEAIFFIEYTLTNPA
jgi:hypothetical protein